jgi:hypothetical protein
MFDADRNCWDLFSRIGLVVLKMRPFLLSLHLMSGSALHWCPGFCKGLHEWDL